MTRSSNPQCRIFSRWLTNQALTDVALLKIGDVPQLECPLREVIGLEVKAAATVAAADFRGLRRLKEHTGKDFLTGIVFYDGDKSLPFGDGLWAVPLAAL